MNKESVLVGIVGLLLGVVIAGFAAGQAVNNNNTAMMRMMGMEIAKTPEVATSHHTMSMADMSKQLKVLKGDDYDKAFIEMMIVHHEGAVEMSLLSDTRANHAEVKQLSKDIITAQENEIAEMKQWQRDWGYSSDEMTDMMHGDH